ncbi:hypothetical protein AX17_000558 [Amanita inopinata Kibby_2008]|nr:hypothetical protein AX17_000558 [Amanita inopinata Kibby_2008]
MSVKDFVDSTIADNKIVIFSKSWCPYCRNAKTLFATKYKDEAVKILELDEREDGDAIQEYLRQKTKQRTVPNIFVNKEHIGGSDDVYVSHEQGKLKALITG